MVKRVVVAGCRDYDDYAAAEEFMNKYLARLMAAHEVIILSGGCRGADALGERYAAEHGLAVERHPADWNTHGRAAGPIRNREMAEAADYVICFWDGQSRGTRSMLECARAAGKPLRIHYIDR